MIRFAIEHTGVGVMASGIAADKEAALALARKREPFWYELTVDQVKVLGRASPDERPCVRFAEIL